MQDQVDLNQLAQRLRALPKEIASKNGGPLRSALFQAAKLLREDAKAKAPIGDSGELADGIIIKRDKNPGSINNANERYLVGVRRNQRSYYGGFVHWGTDPDNQGPHTAQTFMQDTWDSRQKDAFRVFGETFSRRMDAALRRAKRAS